MKRTVICCLIGLVSVSLMVTAADTARAQAAGKPTEKSLYERLGGVDAIATVVDDFIERLLVNDILNANPAIKASRDSRPKAGLKYHVTALVCSVTGGPEQYTGRSMKDSHKHLNISEAEWQAMAADFKTTLDKFKVPQKEQDELFAIVGTTKADIVTAK
ncbi:MAG: group 1 truncated hemoglobin [candidate division Zixibacteria bacterium]|nr:group 1 truncated hemoglobin [candidate division Zixibacteria bacterium]